MLEEGLRLRFKIGAYLAVVFYFGVEGGEDGGDFLLCLKIWKIKPIFPNSTCADIGLRGLTINMIYNIFCK